MFINGGSAGFSCAAARLFRKPGFYSGLNLNQDKAASRRQYTRYGKASQRCTGLNLIHYISKLCFQVACWWMLRIGQPLNNATGYLKTISWIFRQPDWAELFAVVTASAGELNAELFELAVQMGTLKADFLRHFAHVVPFLGNVVFEIAAFQVFA